MALGSALAWKGILKALPHVVTAADEIRKHVAARRKATPVVDPMADADAQRAALAARLAECEATQNEQARLIALMAEQMQGIARRAAVAYRLGAAGCALATGCGLWLLLH